ncbi:MAG TPA: SAM-dependent methyltransferase [Methylocella sp.]|nr:SAM-dependent methyltransferase [Methylocella sp.]
MKAFENVQGTAFVVAAYRAEENNAPSPLYRDDIVEFFLNDATRRAADEAFAASPEAKVGVKLRTRYMDDQLDERISRGCRQVVILGAGLDTRAVRKRREGLAFFEIDDKATLDFKEKTYGRHGIKAALALIPANYAKEDWITLLIEQGFDPDLRTHVIWEGNSMYLPIGAVRQTAAAIRGRIPDATLSFDYFATKIVDNLTGDPKITALTDYFAQAGAPWVTGIDDIKAFADQQGMQLVETCLVSNLHRRYWPSRIMNVNLLNYYFVCTLATKLASSHYR